MPKLNEGNCSVEKGSGALLYKRSPELLEIAKLSKKLDTLDNKMNEILSLLKGGSEEDGSKVD